MSDQPTEYDDVDARPEDEDVRISSDEADDLPVSPPDIQPRGGEHLGQDASGAEETIDQRIMQEEPDPASAYGAPDNESGLDGPAPVGGDDPDAIPADRDVLGDGGPALDEGLDEPGDAVAGEESAMHVEEG